MSTKFYFLLGISLMFFTSVSAQHEKKIITAKQHIKEKLADWKLTEEDIADLSLDNAYQSEHNGVTHIYLRQQYKGIKIFNAVATVNILPNGAILFSTHRFLPNIESLINTTKPIFSPEEAIQAAARHLEIKKIADLKYKQTTSNHKFLFNKTNISNSTINVELIYQPTADGKIRLAWQLAIDMINKADYWNVRIDAENGELLSKNNWTTHCSFGVHSHTSNCGFLEKENDIKPTSISNFSENSNNVGATYNVFALPLESPSHGNRSIVTNPENPTASPFGWHDTNGEEGAEYTITRGNNVHAYADIEDQNQSIGNEPDGGEGLSFNFPIDLNKEPESYRDAATTQLFYMANMMHDIAFSYGFTEQAGNFQEKNFVEFTGASDYVKAEVQDGHDLIPENSADYTNNANFSTPEDGGNGRIQMYLWERSGGRLLHITEPVEIAGDYDTGTASFGPNVTTTPITGQIVVVDDGTLSTKTLGCNELINAEEVAGKIAIVDRGTCNFTLKAEHAESAGAIGVIICNYENSFIPMGTAPGFVDNLTIPTIMIRRNDCQLLRTLANDGIEVTIQSPPETGPDYLDGDFDNGVVAHEYGHGISGRLTGGRFNTNCLSNDEQMGEGWSDFFTLITSVKEGDTGKEQRGIGTYVQRQTTDAQGIRRFPYSTDMTINPFTYRDIIGTTTEHSVGEVWTTMLWDLYWAMSEKHGWEADHYTGDGGNNRAIQLVMDGMKLQPCTPGFVDGRNAILAADQANNGGANECLIWKAFARRGLGFSASQGDFRDRNDAIESFDLPPFCTKELLLSKVATENVKAGEYIEYTLTLSNFKGEKLTDLVLTDDLPDGLTFKEGSASMEAKLQGNSIRFDINELANGEVMKITYTATTTKEKFSTRQFYDDMENGDDFWLIIDEEANNLWGLQDVFFNSGENAWHVSNPDGDSKQFLQLDEEIEITGNKPSLRFFHWYDIDEGTDGGIVEISTDGGTSWKDLGPHIIKNGYIGPLAYTTFAIPDLEAFWGNSEQFIDTYIDLSAFKGERVSIRFRFGSTDIGVPVPGETNQGWLVDDVEFLDVFSYQSQACVSSSQNDNVCAIAAAGGTVVDAGDLNTDVENLEELGLQFAIFPNPAGDYINVSLSNKKANNGSLSLFNMNGQELLRQNIRVDQTTQTLPINVKDVPSGFYFIKVQTNKGIAVKKIILK